MSREIERRPDPKVSLESRKADVWMTMDGLVAMVFRDERDQELEIVMGPEDCLEWLEVVRKAAQQLVDEKKCNAEGGSA